VSQPNDGFADERIEGGFSRLHFNVNKYYGNIYGGGTTAGDGVFIYPGKRGPLSGTRAETWRDGSEDYELLARLPPAQRSELVRRLVAGKTDWRDDPALLERTRRKAAAQLMAAEARVPPRKTDDEADSARRLGAASCPLTNMVVAVDSTSASELGSAQELALWAGKVAGLKQPLPVVSPTAIRNGQPHFAVGFAAALSAGIQPQQLSLTLGEEGFVASTTSVAGVVVLSGAANSSRGTLYASYHFLHRLGVRFLAPNATVVPPCPMSLPTLRDVIRPWFEYRAVNSWAAQRDPLHAQRSHLNDGEHTALSLDAVAASSTIGASQGPYVRPRIRHMRMFVDPAVWM